MPFEAIERPALLPLPSEPFEYAEWKRCRAGFDYHIEVHGLWYSVPHGLIREVLEARITDHTVEIFLHGVRVAVHIRSPPRHRYTTVPDHMPSAHRRYAGPRPDYGARPIKSAPRDPSGPAMVLARRKKTRL
jgi:transposase